MEAQTVDPTILIPALALGPYWIPHLPLIALASFYFMVSAPLNC